MKIYKIDESFSGSKVFANQVLYTGLVSKDNSLTSLEGAPQSVGCSFNCVHCNSLKSLKGAPKEVGGYFYCDYCKTEFTQDDVLKTGCQVKGKIFY